MADAVDGSEPSVAGWYEQTLAMHVDSETNENDAAAAWQQFVDQWSPALLRSRRAGLARLVIPAAGQSLSNAQRMTIGGALALLTACGCAANHLRTHQQIGQATLAISRLEQEQATQDQMVSALKSGESRLAQLRQEVAQVDMQRQQLERDLSIADATHAQQSLRWVALLDALAEASDSDCWLQRLESTPSRAILTGVAVDNSAAHRFASGLERGLRDCGWVVLPAETKRGGNNLITFRIVIDAKFTAVDADGGMTLSQSATPVRHERTASHVQPAGRRER
jgi:Tfp pilus assembly protein PilN